MIIWLTVTIPMFLAALICSKLFHYISKRAESYFSFQAMAIVLITWVIAEALHFVKSTITWTPPSPETRDEIANLLGQAIREA